MRVTVYIGIAGSSVIEFRFTVAHVQASSIVEDPNEANLIYEQAVV
jgi:hypothetical protein